MAGSAITHDQALKMYEDFVYELRRTLGLLFVTTSKLTNLQASMKTQGMDLQTLAYGSSNSQLERAKELLSRGRELIESVHSAYCSLPILNAATTSGSSTTKSSPPVEPEKA